MGQVMIRCPSTGKAVPTGLRFDAFSFENAQLSANTVTCPHCGKPHTWNKSDAWLDS